MKLHLLLSIALLPLGFGCGAAKSVPTQVAPPVAKTVTAPKGPPAALPTAAFKLPKYDRFTLDNGLTIYLMAHHEVPLIHVSVAVDAGAIHDQRTQAGVASMTAEALLFGAGKYSKRDIEERTDFQGADLATWVGLESAGISAAFSKADSEIFFPMIHAALTAPKFPKKPVLKYRKRLQSQLSQAKESPRAVIGNYFRRLSYGAHVYGNSTHGDQLTIKKLGPKQLKAFHRAHYRPGTTAIAVVGDFEPAKMKARLRSLFSNWKKGTVTKGMVEAPKWAAKARVLLVDKPDARETTFIIGGPGIRRDDPDFVAIKVLNTILGARFTSWLNDALRVESGLTYGAGSNFVNRRSGGSFVISTFTQTATTFEAIALAQKTYARLWKEGIDQKTLDSAKAYLKGQFPPKYETAGQLADLLTDMHVYGFDARFIDTFQSQIDALNREKAAQIITRVFPRENLQFVLIGKADAIREKAKALGALLEVKITDPGFEAQR